MIIDTVRLAGSEAYLRGSAGETNLAASAASNAPLSGSFQVTAKGVRVETDAVSLFLRSPRLTSLFVRHPRPILSLSMNKEVFPGLFVDPYSHRVHTVAGADDFRRGELVHLRVMDVDGVSALVSTGAEGGSWTSVRYRFEAPVRLRHAAWDLATSRLTPEDGFRYDLILQYWANPEATVSAPDGEVVLASDQSPAAPRRQSFPLQQVVAYRLLFRAVVRNDAFIREHHTVSHEDASLGRPLLRAVHLLESIPGAHEFHSVQELVAVAGDFDMVSDGSGPATGLSLSLPLAATLTRREQIRIAAPAGVWEVVEARLDGRVSMRPPYTDKQD